ncbi:MAG: hypothetical protein AMXMBFR7_45510 [Planctomycetota bacterium]
MLAGLLATGTSGAAWALFRWWPVGATAADVQAAQAQFIRETFLALPLAMLVGWIAGCYRYECYAGKPESMFSGTRGVLAVICLIANALNTVAMAALMLILHLPMGLACLGPALVVGWIGQYFKISLYHSGTFGIMALLLTFAGMTARVAWEETRPLPVYLAVYGAVGAADGFVDYLALRWSAMGKLAPSVGRPIQYSLRGFIGFILALGFYVSVLLALFESA